jgi:hypothetical protein
MRKIEKKVTRDAVKRIYKKYFFAGTLAGFFFSSNMIQRLFFKNHRFRRWVENVRHRRMLASKQLALKS